MGRKPKVVVWTANQGRWNKRRMIAGGVIVCLFLAALGAWLFWPRGQQEIYRPVMSQQAGQAQISDASRNLAIGDSEAVLRQTDEVLRQNLTIDQRVALLQQRAGAYQQKGDIDSVLATYRECERLQNGTIDVATAQGLAHVYQVKGDKTLAALYLRKLIAASEATNDPVAEANIPMYREMIRTLGEQP